jgi:hypothetical protein
MIDFERTLAAFNQRPDCVDPLHDLAQHFQKLHLHDVSVLFSQAARGIADRADVREDFAISAFYSKLPAVKARGRETCNALALDRTVEQQTRHLARSNLRFYVQSMDSLFPSATMHHVQFDPPTGYQAGNASIVCHDDDLLLLQRSVNYQIINGCYLVDGGGAIHTRNFLLGLDTDLNTIQRTEVLMPVDLPPPSYTEVLGFEDARAFFQGNELWCSATVLQLNPQGMCEIVLARIDRSEHRFTDWRVIHPSGDKRHEKNWMPVVADNDFSFVYSCDPTRRIDEHGQTASLTTPSIAADNFRGGSQLIAFHGGWLAIIHEVQFDGHLRHYHHRFVWFDGSYTLRKVSPQFFFQIDGIEYAAGLTLHPNGDLLISHSVNDGQSWIARVKAFEVIRSLDSVQAY